MTIEAAAPAPALAPAGTSPRRRSVPPRERAVGGVSQVVLVAGVIVVALPFLWTVMSSFKTSREIFASPFAPPTQLNFVNYVNAWTQAGIGTFFVNTLIVVGGALVLTMVLGAMCAYYLARFEFRGNRVIYWLMVAGLTFPIFLAIVPLFFILKGIGLLGTLPGLAITYAAFALPFTVFFLVPFFKELPRSVTEAAQIDGAGEWRTFFSVMVPMAMPGLSTVAILNFVGLWNQFLLPVALNTDSHKYVLTQGMASFASQAGYSIDFGALFAAVVMTVLPVLIVYLVFQRALSGSIAIGTDK
ncbi:carbohydrate ABC transporter permease [Amnibacterium sp.]|uniref:carbohydrate ABC transporter permease n=1 Tax=Amnibacterium sp. TaxID=1872496 RepID=UPI00262E21CC|nr:carbohydrate ABC transporter permease [Amnibacterium sp.]MCU1472688.1 carbohydrate transporter permease [Amnibacterium sp.]